ncbi:MAG: tRNA preQ1(34) S-adenosylmethionine ribosyltransferase-isomerase QueA [Gammaproteobacteria bacterium]|nr:tRNA preQ1(34) S-adenosylmethionine ribosyltransferase-isomerase QueA [Gammaproteobacteria bacterium]
MRRADFHYDLPAGLIAQEPCAERRASRLLCLHGANGCIDDRKFEELPSLLTAGDLLVLNDTRVIPARLFARKPTGGRVEILIERVLDERRALAHLRPARSIRTGMLLDLPDDARGTVGARHGNLFELELERPWRAFLETYGHVPLPPYIRRTDEQADRERYQTVYARTPGAMAAPTAGLHFDEAMLDELEQAGVQLAHVTLHVGAGTFQPVRVSDIRQHRMHGERVIVGADVCAAVKQTQAAGGRVIAVGTTVARSLESAVRDGELVAFEGETRLFIYPGFRFRIVDALLTNFHLPESTLLMLVAAFAGRECVLGAYRYAVRQGYRFFSYGDAMFVTPAASTAVFDG